MALPSKMPVADSYEARLLNIACGIYGAITVFGRTQMELEEAKRPGITGTGHILFCFLAQAFPWL